MNANSLESRPSLDADLSRYLRSLKSRWLLIAVLWGGTVGLAGIAASLKLPTYEASSKILVRTDPTSTLTGVGRGVGDLDSLVKAQNPLTTEIEIISSKPVIEQVIQQLELKNDTGELLTPEEFSKRLTVKIVGGADVIRLSYQDADPTVAAAVVNELAKLYIENNAQDQQQRTLKALESIEDQLPETQQFVQRTEEQLRRFREENQVISLADESRSLVNALEAMDAQIAEAQAALNQITVEATTLQQSLGLTPEQALAISDVSQSPSVQTIMQELLLVERNQAIQGGIYQPANPAIAISNTQATNLRQLLDREIALILGARSPLATDLTQVGDLRQTMINRFLDAEVERLSLLSRVQSLQEFRQSYRSRADSLPELEQKQAALEQTLNVARSTYQTLLQRLKELEAAKKQDIGNATVIEPAEIPDKPVSGERSKILALGGLLGAFVATTVVTLMTLRDEERLRQEQMSLHQTEEMSGRVGTNLGSVQTATPPQRGRPEERATPPTSSRHPSSKP